MHEQAHATSRPLALLALVVIAAGALVSRLVFWQVMQHGHLTAEAAAQRSQLLAQAPLRGLITDVHNNPLATNVTLDQVTALPREMKDPRAVAQALAPVLGQSESYLEKLFSEYRGYVLLASRVPSSVSAQIKLLRLPGIVLRPTISRDYPEASTASQLLGFVNVDKKGQFGLEGYYDHLLSGKAGLGTILRDTAGNDIRLSSGPPSPAQNGVGLQLSVDGVVQNIVEHELRKAVKKHGAAGGTIVVMDPGTGFVLGMANTPTYNPNHYGHANPAYFRNPAAEWTYEPGSTFKILTMAAGLDTGVITRDTAFDDTGAFTIGGATIHNWNGGGFGQETMTQVLQHSANVGAAWVAQHLTDSQYYSYLQKFGLGRLTGVDLADEQSGQLPLPGSKPWTIVNKYTNSYGQGLAVTPIQLIRAVGAVANGGLLMKPQVVMRMTGGGRIVERRPVVQGRVVSARTAATLTNMLVHSAVNGEAQLALVKGYDIAVKTGTANIAGPNGGYITNSTIASVIGYAPAIHPKFIALVILDRPKDTIWGSEAAAPVLHTLCQELFLHYHIAPSPHALNQ